MNAPLLVTNPYLADPVKRRAMFIQTVISSSAVEGIRLTPSDFDPSADGATVAPRPHKAKISGFNSRPRNHIAGGAQC